MLNSSALTSGAAAYTAEERKRTKYRGLTDRFLFAPLAFETSGVFGPEAHKIISDVGARMKRQTGEPKETLWLYQRFSLDIQRGNLATIMSAVLNANPRGIPVNTSRPRWPPIEPSILPPLHTF